MSNSHLDNVIMFLHKNQEMHEFQNENLCEISSIVHSEKPISLLNIARRAIRAAVYPTAVC